MTGNSVSKEKFALNTPALRFWWNFHGMCIDIFEYVLQRFTAIFKVL